jgi:hypothetical protein
LKLKTRLAAGADTVDDEVTMTDSSRKMICSGICWKNAACVAF